MKHRAAPHSEFMSAVEPVKFVTRRYGTVKPINGGAALKRALSEAKAAPVVVDFFATWCRPCQLMEPELAKLAAEFPEVMFLKMDGDANKARARPEAGPQAAQTLTAAPRCPPPRRRPSSARWASQDSLHSVCSDSVRRFRTLWAPESRSCGLRSPRPWEPGSRTCWRRHLPSARAGMANLPSSRP